MAKGKPGSASSSSSSSQSGSSSSSDSSAPGSPPRKAAPSSRHAEEPAASAAQHAKVEKGSRISPGAVKRRRVDAPRAAERIQDSPSRPRGNSGEQKRSRREREASPPRRRERQEDAAPSKRRQNGAADGGLPPPPPRHDEQGSRKRSGGEARGRKSGRTRFDEAPPPEAPDAAAGDAAGADAHDSKGRVAGDGAKREAQASKPLPGPPPGPPLPGPPPGPPLRREATDREWSKGGRPGDGFPEDAAPKEAAEVEPNFALSGKLAEESNTVRGVVLLHGEPPEARKPGLRWRLYTFKNGEPFGEPLYIHRQSCYLFGRERRVADVPTDHPSCSKQHAVLQYRLTEKEAATGMMESAVRPYLMDLGSTNGSFLNNERLESERYYELYEKDLVRFGNSSREYVLLHEKSSEEA